MTDHENGTGDGKWIPPYLGWRNFLHLLDRLENNLPPRIDRSFLTGSNAVNTITLASLRSLGMIDAEGRPLSPLIALATKPEQRKDALAAALRALYPEPVALGTTNATQGQLEEAFAKWGIAGDTRRKAIAFYLNAARFAGIPVSANFRTPAISRSDGAPVKKGARKRRQTVASPASDMSDPLRADAGAAGGADNVADLKRRFIQILVDKVEKADEPDTELLDRVQALLFDTPSRPRQARGAKKDERKEGEEQG